MKFIAKIALASALALSAAPAFASSDLNSVNIPPEARTQIEQQLTLAKQGGREVVRSGSWKVTGTGLRSFAQEPALANVDRNDPSIY